MSFHPRQPPILWWFIPLSLALHLLLVLLVPSLAPQAPRQPDEPVFVEVRPPEPREQPLSRELDVPVLPELETPREEPARRLGPQDQVVERETAPIGEDPEDSPPSRVAPVPQPRPEAQPRPTPREEVPAPPVVERPAEQAPPRTAVLPEELRPAPPSERPLPDVKDLLKLPEATESRLESELRSKYRADVDKGDAVWLDMERDILVSFFQRFRNNIYGVWNYPRRAAEAGEEGTSMLKIVINRDGSVQSVQLMETSGSALLDQEAIRAVWRGASYGNLPRAYEDETLTIFAFFQYRIGRTFVF
jgi:periplasmic protein TonB